MSNPLDNWLERQITTITDWLRRKLGLPVDPPEPNEPPSPPDPPAPDPDAIVGSMTFLWKPVSESSGKVAVLLPCVYRLDSPNDPWRTASNAQLIASLSVEGGDRDGDKPGSAYRPADDANGRRIHTRWGAAGKKYGKDFDVVLALKDGNIKRWRIKDGAKRHG